MICNLPYMHWSAIKTLWSHGDINIKRPKNLQHVIFYIPKYFGKNAQDPRLIGYRSFTYSRNLKKSQVIRGERAEILGEKLSKNLTMIGQPEDYYSEFHGKVTKILYTAENYRSRKKKS